ncbi:MAG: hypothetical protein HQM00_09775 [Magnetococcales bacterium]|nr:hypothetical protein [Magnetococcales bacterium]
METAQLIVDRFRAKEKIFVSRNEFFKVIGVVLGRRLGVTVRDSVVMLAEALKTHCGDRLRVMQGGRTYYVVLNLPDEAFLLDKAKRLNTFTPAQLALNLPLSKVRVVPALTRLLESGQIVCVAVKPDFTPLFRRVESPSPETHLPETRSPEASPAPAGEPDESLFYRAFLEIGQGRNFVAIHRLRAHLGWERQRFDQILLRLRADERILLNMGDPSRLTRSELDNAFQDHNGMRYLTLNWLDQRS